MIAEHFTALNEKIEQNGAENGDEDIDRKAETAFAHGVGDPANHETGQSRQDIILGRHGEGFPFLAFSGHSSAFFLREALELLAPVWANRTAARTRVVYLVTVSLR